MNQFDGGKINILIATPFLPPAVGGPARYAVSLGISLEKIGCIVTYKAFSDVIRLPSGIRHIVFFLQVLRVLRKINYIIVLDTMSVALPVVFASFLLRRNVFIRTGGDFVWEHYVNRTGESVLLSEFYTTNPKLSFKERVCIFLQRTIIFPLTDTLIFSTQWQRDIWMKPYGLLHHTIEIIENAYVPIERSVRVSMDSKRIVCIGRNIPLKNISLLNKAIEKVQKEYPSLEYETFTNLHHEAVIDVFRSARFLVIPSVSEVSPNTALEALALGVPVVLTQDCGLKDLLKDSVVWIDSRSIDDIVLKISRLMTDEGYDRAKANVLAFHTERNYDDVAREFVSVMHRR